MVVNKMILSKVLDGKGVRKMQDRARRLKVKIWYVTMLDDHGRVFPIAHFDLDELIEKVEEWSKTTLERYRRDIAKYADEVKQIKERLNEQDRFI